MKTLLSLLQLLILMAGLSLPALASQTDGEQRVPTVTRLVQIFSTLENDLMTAVAKGDSTTFDKILSDDFELRSGAMPGTPTPRAGWLRHSRGQIAAPIQQMAVHDHGTVAVVSYISKLGTRHDIFVVDVWRKSGDGWMLSTRYSSPAGDQHISIPGAEPEILPFEKK